MCKGKSRLITLHKLPYLHRDLSENDDIWYGVRLTYTTSETSIEEQYLAYFNSPVLAEILKDSVVEKYSPNNVKTEDGFQSEYYSTYARYLDSLTRMFFPVTESNFELFGLPPEAVIMLSKFVDVEVIPNNLPKRKQK